MSNLSKRLAGHLGALILLFVMIDVSTLVVHNILSRMYYQSSLISMQTVAEMAVRAGVVYLPLDPGAAVRVADAFVKLNGGMPCEIVSTEVSPDEHTLTIALKWELPTHVTLFVPGLSGREITVTAQARRSQVPETRLAI